VDEGSSGTDGRSVEAASPSATAVRLVAVTAALGAVAVEVLRRPDRHFLSAVASFDLMVVAAVAAVVALLMERPKGAHGAAGWAGSVLAVLAAAARMGNGQATASIRAVVVVELVAALSLAYASVPGVRSGWPDVVARALRTVGGTAVGMVIVATLLDPSSAPIVQAGRRPELFGLVIVAGAGLIAGATGPRVPVALAWSASLAFQLWTGAGAPLGPVPMALLILACLLAWAPALVSSRAAAFATGVRRAGRTLRRGMDRVWATLRCGVRSIGSESRSTAAPAPRWTLAELSARQRWISAAVAATTVGAVALTVVHARRLGWYPIGDVAIIATRAGDVGGSHTPLLGMPSTLGPAGPQGLEVHHPGPLQLWFTAPFVRALGPSLGVMVAAASIWFAAVAAMVWAAFRARGPVAAALAYALGLVVALTAASGVPFEPLNAQVPIVPLAAVYVLAWAAACGVRSALIWAVAFGSLCMQAYLPLAPAAAVALVFATGAVAVPRLRPRGGGSPWRTLLGAGAVGLVVWSGPIVEAAAHGGGNVRKLLEVDQARAATVGSVGAVRSLVGLVSVPPSWLVPGPFRVDEAATYLARGTRTGAVVLLAALGAAIWRWSHWDQGLRRLAVLAGAGLATGAATLTQLPAAFVFSYQVWWVGAVGAFAWFAAVVVLASEVPRSRTWSGAKSTAAWMVLAVGLASLVVALARPRGLEHYSQVAAGSQLAAQGVSGEIGDGPGGSRPVAVLADGRSWEQVIANSLAMSLADRGRDIRVTPLLGGHWGAFRLAEQDPNDPVLIVSDGFSPEDPGVGRRVARFVPPGWSQADAEATAARVAALARREGPILARPGYGGIVRSVIFGWDRELSCRDLAEMQRGVRPLDTLPDGAIAQLYLEGVVALPVLPADVLVDLEERLLATPTEVWLASASEAQAGSDGPIAGSCDGGAPAD
jgi:hypothetical protein